MSSTSETRCSGSGVHADSGLGLVRRFVAISPPLGLPRWLSGEESKNPVTNVRDAGSIPGWGRSPEVNGNPLRYSCMEDPTDSGAWQAMIHGVARGRSMPGLPVHHHLLEFTQTYVH